MSKATRWAYDEKLRPAPVTKQYQCSQAFLDKMASLPPLQSADCVSWDGAKASSSKERLPSDFPKPAYPGFSGRFSENEFVVAIAIRTHRRDGDSPEKLGLVQSNSAPTLSSSVQQTKVMLPLRAPKRKVRPRKLPPDPDGWNDRHAVVATENESLPKKKRSYFLAPQTEAELRADLAKRKSMTLFLQRMDEEEVPPAQPTKISADAGPPAIPSKHEIGGTMTNYRNEVEPWNSRHCAGLINDGVHPVQREYFDQASSLTSSPSQQWRRFADIEVRQGEWRPITINPRAKRKKN